MPVKIFIKEVYSQAEILYAGLTTESDGRLLESGGMVYIDAIDKNGKRVQPSRPVRISIPSDYRNDKMQLFKGKELADGSINWVDPQPLDTTPSAETLRQERAKTLFQSKCQSCHSIFGDMTGPALAGMEERVPDRAIIAGFIRNPAATMFRHHYFLCLKNRYGSVMTALPDLSDDDIDGLIEYVKSEAGKRPDLKGRSSNELRFPDSAAIERCAAPCGYDTMYVDTTRQWGLSDNFMPLEATVNDSADSQYKDPSALEAAQRKGFTDKINTSGRYNFSIKTLGWFNVDAFYDGLEGTVNTDLFVRTDFDKPGQLDIHVFFPAQKLLTVGVFHSGDGLFHFEKYKGQIPLFPNDHGVVLATASIGEKVFYGIKEFDVDQEQTVFISVKESSPEALTKAFKETQLEGISLDLITKKRVIFPKSCTDSSTVSWK